MNNRPAGVVEHAQEYMLAYDSANQAQRDLNDAKRRLEDANKRKDEMAKGLKGLCDSRRMVVFDRRVLVVNPSMSPCVEVVDADMAPALKSFAVADSKS